MLKWQCTSCGYVHDGDSPPESCPKCGAPAEKFEQLPEDRAQLIERSRFTNGLHLQLYALLEEAATVAEKGIQDNLDPACVRIFQTVQAEARVSQQRIKAEIQGHISKGKWG